MQELKEVTLTANKKRTRLIGLGPEVLADTLLKLAMYNREVEDAIEHLASDGNEKCKRFKSQLAQFKRMDFIDWKGSRVFARQLELLLSGLKDAGLPPQKGVELVAAFFEADADIFDHADDSDGNICTVFRDDAADAFSYFAADCPNKDWLVEIVLLLNSNDDYGVRDTLFERVGNFLPEDQIKILVDKLWSRANGKTAASGKYIWLHALKLVAISANDPQLLETACRDNGRALMAKDYLDIARIHFNLDNAEEALSWVKQAPKDVSLLWDSDDLIKSIYKKLGNRSEIEKLAWQRFNSYHSKETLKELLSAIGKDKRQDVLANTAKKILQSKQLDYTNLEFLIEVALVDEAEQYLLNHADKLDGSHYYTLTRTAEVMKKQKRDFAATIIYRKLLTSILDRAQSKAYEYGADYLQELKRLAKNIKNWQNLEHHEQFLADLREKHKRKTGFWSAVARIKS